MTSNPTAGTSLDPLAPVPPVRDRADPAGETGTGPPERRARTRDIVALLRPGQWPKNVYSMLLVALAAGTWNLPDAGRLLRITAVFVLVSAAVYVGNDLADRRNDRLHPVKRNRPLAAGRVRPGAALGLLAVLLGSAGALLATGPAAHWWPVAAYLAVNVGYSAGLKHVPLVDAFLVSLGFQLRLAAGHLAVGAAPSQWLMIAVLAVCLMLILGKRRHELVATGPAGRPALRGYTVHLTEQMINVCGVVTVVSMLVYLQNDAPLGAGSGPVVLIAAPLLLFGLFRYLQVLVVERGGADPVRILLRDPALLICTAALGVTFLVAALTAPPFDSTTLPAPYPHLTTAWNLP